MTIRRRAPARRRRAIRDATGPAPGRAVLIAFWDDDHAIDRFVAEHPLATRFASGWQARLEPIRAHGTWPGLPADVYGRGAPAHADAIAAGEAKPFHHQQAFIRFRPHGARGHLDGKNPLPSRALAS